MDTERLILTDGGKRPNNLQKLSPQDIIIAETYVETTRHLQEIHQLYQIFIFQIENFLSRYTLYNSGGVYKNHDVFDRLLPADSDSDHIAINVHIISIISAGRTLSESMESYIKENYAPHSTDYRSYFDFSTTPTIIVSHIVF